VRRKLYRNGTERRLGREWGTRVGGLPLVLGGLLGCVSPPAPEPPETVAPSPRDVVRAEIPHGFMETAFGGEGLASIEPNRILLEPGVPLSGVTWTGAPPEAPYTLEVEFTKRYGNDFPCALTFPIAGSHLTLVLGGWGGTVCGLSSLDGLDASRNETRFVRAFPPGVRTEVRVDVQGARVRAVLDGVEVVRIDLAGRSLGVREELSLSRPLGIAAFATAVEVHSVRWGPLAIAYVDRAAGPKIDARPRDPWQP
jgi:hypothetical protein